MTFMHKLSQRLALLRDRIWRVVPAVPAAVARRLSHRLRFVSPPALPRRLPTLGHARPGRLTRIARVGVCVVLGLAACEQPRAPTGPTAPVASVVVSPATVSLVVGTTQQLTATPEDGTGVPLSGRQVTWASGNTALATVSSSGLVTGILAGGPVTIAATSEGKSGSASTTIMPVPVASVSVTPAAATVAVGQTVQLTATPLDANGAPLSGRVVTWASTNIAVATVAAGGLVTGVAPGNATIAASSEGQNGPSLITVSNVAVVPVASVAVSPSSGSVPVGGSLPLTATPQDASGAPLSGRVVTWSSGNTAIATVSSSGLVTGVGAGGPVTITATSEGKSGTAAITVTAPTGLFAIGDSVLVTVAAWVRNVSQPPADPPTGTPPNVIGTQPVGARGIVDSGPVLNTTPGGDGAIRYHVLFATGASGWVVQNYLTKIVPTVPVASVTVSPASASVLQGQTVQLTATPKDASGTPLTGRVITWSSGNTAVATVSSSGLVTAVAGGSATIMATSEGKSGTAAISVTSVPVASVTVSPPSASVPQGQTVQLTATPKDATGTPLTGRVVTWSSGNTAVATVSSSGLVTGVGAGGPVTITATSEGQSGLASITVTVVVPVASVSVAPAAASVQQGQTVQLTATPKDALGNPLSGRVVTWSSGNTAVATVSSSGLVTGVGPGGPVTITAMSEAQSGLASITVTAVPVASVTVSPSTASVAAGSKLQLTATPKDALGTPLSGRVVTWSSGNTALATVDGSGLVTGVAAGGPVTITALSEGKSGTAAVTVTPLGTGSQFNHVFVVLEENTNAADVTATTMPYLMGLAAQYGNAMQYYAVTHPSIGNYLMLTTGQVITNDDSYSSPSINVDNVVRQLLAAGKTWKAYAEDLPSVGFVTMGVEVGKYAARHNPLVYLSDVHDNPTQANNVVPFTQFATDLTANTLPNYAFIVPNLCNDAHDCVLGTADSWLRTNIDPLVKSAQFQQDGLLLILFDESGSDNTNGGGRVTWVAVSPSKSKRAYQSTTLYQHQSTLRLTLKGLGVTVFPGAAATAPDMSEFFNP
jgi:uncharacterized protein YjdB